MPLKKKTILGKRYKYLFISSLLQFHLEGEERQQIF